MRCNRSLCCTTQLLREPYRDWADGHIGRIKSVLQSARAEHTQAVKDRISSVENMKNVTDLTKALFALSKVDDTQHTG
jgi:F-type H+-transporting ATPase subunit b